MGAVCRTEKLNEGNWLTKDGGHCNHLSLYSLGYNESFYFNVIRGRSDESRIK